MFLFIFSLIFLIAGCAVGIYLFATSAMQSKRQFNIQSGQVEYVEQTIHPYRKYSFIGFLVGVILFISCFLPSILTTVPTGHTGVLTTFGNVEEQTLDAGMHTKKPWQKVVKMDNRVQKETVELSCFSKDIQEVEIKYTINYQIDKVNAQNIYRTIGPEYYTVVVEPSIAEAVKVITAQYTAENLVSTRSSLASEIELLLETQLQNYNINVVSTAIEDMDFTDEFTNAVEQKQVAVQNKLKAQTEQEQKTMEAEQAAERAKIEAMAAAEVAQIQASADKAVAEIGADSAEYQGKKEAAIALQRLASINGWTVVVSETGINELYKADGTKVSSDELKVGSEKLMRYYYIEQWDGVLPETIAGADNLMALLGLND